MTRWRQPLPRRRPTGQPRTLRTRLVVASVVLIAVVCAVIGTVTTVALRSHLFAELDGRLSESVERIAFVDLPGKGGKKEPIDLSDFVTRGPQPQGTIGAELIGGTVTDAQVGERSSPEAQPLDPLQTAALLAVPRDGHPHTADIPGLGQYRVQFTSATDGIRQYYVAIPTTDVNNTLRTLLLIEISVTAAGLIAASLAGAVIVNVATRPLRRVATTATRVSELPLHSGEVNLDERVPESETDPHTEVGQVGLALNRLLDHVHGALHSRQQSETRVRQFVADASHELRTPLASIRGYAELTRRGREEIGPDTRHALRRIESEADRMTLLVEDLLLLARLDAGRPLQFERTDLVPLVVDTVSDARAAGMDHTWRLALPEEPAPVCGDAARLQQVLVNLLGNARTHTPPGTTITARVRRSGPWLCVDVCDDGPGIPPALVPRVFERFARGDTARTRATGSTGLGLAIVEAVATAHGGAVSVDSRPGHTAFTVHLPAAAAADTPPRQSLNGRQHPAQSGHHSVANGQQHPAQSSQQHPVLNGQHPTPNGQHPARNGQAPTPTGQHPTPNGQHPAPSSQQHPVANGQHPTPNGQHPAPTDQHPTPADQRQAPPQHATNPQHQSQPQHSATTRVRQGA